MTCRGAMSMPIVQIVVSKFPGKVTDFRYSEGKGLNDPRTSYCTKKLKKKSYQRQNQKIPEPMD